MAYAAMTEWLLSFKTGAQICGQNLVYKQDNEIHPRFFFFAVT